jgi:hypothetical protein
LADLDAAKREAVDTLLGIAHDRFPNGLPGELLLTIRDASGPLFAARLVLEIA